MKLKRGVKILQVRFANITSRTCKEIILPFISLKLRLSKIKTAFLRIDRFLCNDRNIKNYPFCFKDNTICKNFVIFSY